MTERLRTSPRSTEEHSEQAEGSDTNPEAEIQTIHEQVATALVDHGVPLEKISDGNIRKQTVLYMVYWFSRLRNNTEEQARIRKNLIEYIGATAPDPSKVADALCSDAPLRESATKYVESFLVPTKTVDLVLSRAGSESERDKEILCLERTYYPQGLALPGGIIKEEDEDNDLNLPPQVFAALRVAGEKVLGTKNVHYSQETDTHGKRFFLVRGETELPIVRLHPEDENGYRYSENIKSVLRPSDPRHIVDTVGYKCEVEGEPNGPLAWKRKSAIMSPNDETGGFAFGHHREIVAHITARTSVEKEREMQEHEFVRNIIASPLESYRSMEGRFASEKNASFKELFPVVDKILAEAFTEDMNELCRTVPILAGIRDKAVISLRHVSLKNRTFCPYLSTLRAIAEGVAFFDIAARQRRGFYDTMPKDGVVEHNPAETPYASYHMYRYKYRLDELMGMIPNEIVIPTFEPLSATDLMRVRGVPIHFVGLSKDFLYVDEFEQSPEEFFMHDCNHSWRMIMEDNAAEKKYGRTKQELIEESNAFIKEYLEQIKIRSTDTEEEREIKKLKKIILFEIVHEDAKPFLKDVISTSIQTKEGSAVPFEVPHIDRSTGYMDVVDTLDTGISTLSYVRNKLQNGFYDHVDAQLPQIVGPKYRTAAWITRAAYDMLVELEAAPTKEAELDADGRTSYEWLLKRTCAVGPDNIHAAREEDPAVAQYGDGAAKLNPKRYQV